MELSEVFNSRIFWTGLLIVGFIAFCIRIQNNQKLKSEIDDIAPVMNLVNKEKKEPDAPVQPLDIDSIRANIHSANMIDILEDQRREINRHKEIIETCQRKSNSFAGDLRKEITNIMNGTSSGGEFKPSSASYPKPTVLFTHYTKWGDNRVSNEESEFRSIFLRAIQDTLSLADWYNLVHSVSITIHVEKDHFSEPKRSKCDVRIGLRDLSCLTGHVEYDINIVKEDFNDGSRPLENPSHVD